MRLLILGAALAALSSPAFADTGIKLGNWYAGLQGGLNIMQDADASDSTGSGEIRTDEGFAVGGYAGYRLDNGIRLEAEGTYRQNDLDELSVDTVFSIPVGGVTVPLDGDVSSFAFMANIWFEPQVGEHWLPYIGGGIGGVYIDADASSGGVSLIDDSTTVFGGQVGAGVGYAITSNVVVSLDYRFMVTADPEFDEVGTSDKLDAEYLNHSIMVGVRGHF